MIGTNFDDILCLCGDLPAACAASSSSERLGIRGTAASIQRPSCKYDSKSLVAVELEPEIVPADSSGLAEERASARASPANANRHGRDPIQKNTVRQDGRTDCYCGKQKHAWTCRLSEGALPQSIRQCSQAKQHF